MVPYFMQNPVKILVVDDSPTLCLFMTRALEKAGYRVITASNGNEGLQKTLHERPHCVVVDVVLPGISGFSLCRQIRSLDPQRRIPIIMVSTKNTPLDQSWGLRQGADRYLAKPFTDEALVHTVQEVMQARSIRNGI
jgi:DNA-binding response OmpR family regulator